MDDATKVKKKEHCIQVGEHGPKNIEKLFKWVVKAPFGVSIPINFYPASDFYELPLGFTQHI
jgi:hypothetical protein